MADHTDGEMLLERTGNIRIELMDGDQSLPLIQPLVDRVYPDGWPQQPGRGDLRWANADQRLMLYKDDILCSIAALYSRRAVVNGKLERIAGIGGVMTDPEHRKKGHGRQVMEQALQLQSERQDLAFALLFCPPKRQTFYASMGWLPFDGKIYNERMGKSQPFDLMAAMVKSLASLPRARVISICAASPGDLGG